MVRLFRGTCEAVRAMHSYRAPVSTSTSNGNARKPAAATSSSTANQNVNHDQDDEHEDQTLPHPEGDADGGYSYDGASVPLITKRRIGNEGNIVFDGDTELEQLRTEQPLQDGAKVETVPYAHRDIKPGQVPTHLAIGYNLIFSQKCYAFRRWTDAHFDGFWEHH